MLTFEQIKELIELVSTHRLTGVEVERSGFRLKIDGEQVIDGETVAAFARSAAARSGAAGSAAELAAEPASATVAPAAEPAAEPAASAAAVAGAEPELPADAHILKSPIVGTFFREPNPDSDPYVKVGDRVEEGQILCIVEAMKLMNEIEADFSGVIHEIYPQNAQPVEFGEPLFVILPR